MNSAELITALRNCSSAEGTCAECAYKSRVFPGTCNGCKWDMMQDAADALEAAEQRIAELSLDCEMFQQKCMELEAQKPKEGEWLGESDGYTWYGRCSICGYEFVIDSHYAENNYCPNCGARMKGERNDQDNH